MSDRVSRLPTTVQANAVERRRRLPIGWPRRRETVVRQGVVATAIAPLAVALAALLMVAGLAALGTSWWTGYSRDAVYSRAVQPDTSGAAIETGQRLEDPVTLVIRDSDGELRRLVAERDAADRFLNETLRRLDAERERIRAAASAEVETIFSLAFADSDAAIERYADWFFEWKRSYVVLKEAAVSAATRLVEFGRYESLPVAVERDLADYFLRHYSEQVLRPEHRDPLIAQAFEEAVRRAHERWQRVVAEQELRLQVFLAEHTRHLDDYPADARMSEVVLDWDAQRFKAPVYLMEDKAFDGVVSLATVGAGSALGALALRPAVERVTSRVFAGLGRRYVAAYGGRLAMAGTGARLGNAVQPVSGAAVGAVAGGLVAIAADYAVNRADAALNRKDFVAANREAVELTVGTWEGKLEASLHAAIDDWFHDTRAAAVQAD